MITWPHYASVLKEQLELEEKREIIPHSSEFRRQPESVFSQKCILPCFAASLTKQRHVFSLGRIRAPSCNPDLLTACRMCKADVQNRTHLVSESTRSRDRLRAPENNALIFPASLGISMLQFAFALFILAFRFVSTVLKKGFHVPTYEDLCAVF